MLHHNRKALRMLVKHGSDVRPLMEVHHMYEAVLLGSRHGIHYAC